jgi:hypothetical protein
MRGAILLFLVACGGGPPPQAPVVCPTCPACPPVAGAGVDKLDFDPATDCGDERKDIKMGFDRPEIDLTPRRTTIAELLALPWPDPDKKPTQGTGEERWEPTETTAFLLTDVTLVCAKQQADQDWHLVVRDGDKMMVIELVHPGCLRTKPTPFRAGIVKARKSFEDYKASHPVPRCKGGAHLMTADAGTVSVLGVGFHDRVHGSIGESKNGLELHPVIGMCFTRGCAP